MSRPQRVFVTLLLFAFVQGCAGTRPAPQPDQGQVVRGTASWYGQEFAGRATANGEIFDPLQFTAAHRTLPFGTLVEVTSVANGRSVRVRINDRGPFVGNRVIDLSWAAARAIGLDGPGTGPVELRVLGQTSIPLAAPVIAETPPPEIDIPIPSRPEPIREALQRPRPIPAAGFYVQFGSFQREENAEALRARIAGVFSSVKVEATSGMHRVRVGPFSTREEAIEIRESLEQAGFSGIVMSAE
jgi:rare lipoprotein A